MRAADNANADARQRPRGHVCFIASANEVMRYTAGGRDLNPHLAYPSIG